MHLEVNLLAFFFHRESLSHCVPLIGDPRAPLATFKKYGKKTTTNRRQNRTKQKVQNQRKINAIHEATLVVKALLWLCLLSIY